MSGNGAKLMALTRVLVQEWNQTKECWRDAKCEEFERKYIQELTAGVDRAVAVIEQLDKLIAKIRRDCE